MMATLDTVLAHLRAGEFAKAEHVCRAALTDQPDAAALLTFRGVSLYRLGRSEESVAVLRRAVALAPEAADALTNLAVLLELIDRSAEAAACFDRLRVIQPDSLLACQRMGAIRQAMGDTQMALRHIRRAVRLQPAGITDLFNLGTLLIHSGLVEPAARCFQTLMAFEPDNPVAYTQLGGCRLADGRIGPATAAYDRGHRLAPANAEARDGRIRCLRYRVTVAASRHSAVPEGLSIRGPRQGVSGYAHMTDRFVKVLSEGGTRLCSLGLLGGEAWTSPLELPVRSRSIVSCLIPPTVEPVPGLMTVNVTMFEGTRIPLFWRRFSERHDMVIVPTEASRIAWAERGFPGDRLRVCPLGVDMETLEGPVLPLATADGRPVSSFRHRVLNVSDFIPRKNIDGVLRVWLTATSAADDAVLILKLGKGNPQTRAAIDALFRQTEALVGKRLAEAAPILVVDRTVDEEAMTALFRAATHYWSLSHGEGWDLPMSKAGAMGLQLVAPAHSSYVDYLDGSVARMIPSTVGPAHLPNSREPWPTFFGLDWWEPDEDAAAAIIGRIVRGEDEETRDARGRLLERFTWRLAGERLLGVLREVGAL